MPGPKLARSAPAALSSVERLHQSTYVCPRELSCQVYTSSVRPTIDSLYIGSLKAVFIDDVSPFHTRSTAKRKEASFGLSPGTAVIRRLRTRAAKTLCAEANASAGVGGRIHAHEEAAALLALTSATTSTAALPLRSIEHVVRLESMTGLASDLGVG